MQDIVPPRNGEGRGAIRPPTRSVSSVQREPARQPVRPVRSIDGVVGGVPVPKPVATPPEEVARPTPPAYPEPPRYIDGVTNGSVKSKGPVEPMAQQQTVSEVQFTEALKEPVKTIEGAEQEPSSVAPVAAKAPPVKKRYSLKRVLVTVLMIVIIIIAGYVAITAWMGNSTASTQAEAEVQGNTSSADTALVGAEEGQDESKITESILTNYTVAPDLPRALYVEKLNIAARVLPMSLNAAGNIQAPLNIYDAGWYTGSVKPGETGAMFIDGHASGPTREGLFAYLDTLKVNDELQIEKGDGSKLTYKVVHVETVPLADVDMKKVLLPYGNASKAMNLMTCTGEWLPREKTYDHRVLVYTEQVET